MNSKKSSNSKIFSADQGFYYIHVTLYQEQVMALQQQAAQQKWALEQQAMQLTMEYQQKKFEEEMQRQQYDMERVGWVNGIRFECAFLMFSQAEDNAIFVKLSVLPNLGQALEWVLV